MRFSRPVIVSNCEREISNSSLNLGGNIHAKLLFYLLNIHQAFICIFCLKLYAAVGRPHGLSCEHRQTGALLIWCRWPKVSGQWPGHRIGVRPTHTTARRRSAMPCGFPTRTPRASGFRR